MSLQNVAQRLAGLNSDVMKQVQNHLSFQRSVVCTAHTNSPRYNTEINPLWTPAWVLSRQLAFDPHTRTGLHLLHVPSTHPIVWADVSDMWLLYSQVTDSAVEQAKRLLTSTGPVPQSHLKPVSYSTATALPSDEELKESEDAWNNTRDNNLR